MPHPTTLLDSPRDGTSKILEAGLPASIEAEQFVLGTVLLAEQMLHPISASLTADDWSTGRHKCIFLAMLALHRKRSAIDALTLVEQLQSEGLLDKVGGVPCIASLTDGLPRLANIDSYIRIVKDKSCLRQMIFAAQHIINDCAGPGGDRNVSDILADAQTTVLLLSERPTPGASALTRMSGTGGWTLAWDGCASVRVCGIAPALRAVCVRLGRWPACHSASLCAWTHRP